MSSLNDSVVLFNYFCHKCGEEFDLLFDNNSCPHCHSEFIGELANADALGLTGAEGGEALDPVNSLYEDDNTVKLISTRIPNTAKKSFHESVDKGIKAFTELSTNHTSVKRITDETTDWFKKSKSEVKELFHKMYSTLQMREKEFMEEMDKTEDNRLKDLKIHMNEILSKRSELKGKLFQCPQTQTDKDRTVLKKLIDQLVANSNVLPMNSPQNEFKLFFDPTVEEKLKIFGSIDVISNQCSICLDDIESPRKVLKCKHIYHKKCITDWLHNSNSCPVCRKAVDPSTVLTPNFGRSEGLQSLSSDDSFGRFTQYLSEDSSPDSSPDIWRPFLEDHFRQKRRQVV